MTSEIQELERRLRELLAESRRIDVEFLTALLELDRRRGYEAYGLTSLWEFCRRVLGLLEGATYRRTHAVAMLRRFPFAMGYLQDGRLTMSSLVMLESAANDENARDLFDRASGRSKKEIEQILVTVKPKPELRDLVRALPQRLPPPSTDSETAPPTASVSDPASASPPASVPAALAAAPREDVRPVSESRYTLQLTVSKSFVERLDRVREILGHAVPDGRLEEVLGRALDVFLEKEARKLAGPEKPRAPKPPTNVTGRAHIPAALARQVRARDQGCCSWKMPGGGVCGSRRRLQIDHVIPVARGGRTVLENLRLLCAHHNDQHARECFGEKWMERAKTRRRAGDPAAAPRSRGDPPLAPSD